MATLTERAALAVDGDLQKRVEVALAAECVTILLATLASASSDAEKKALRIRQRWAERALSEPARYTTKLTLMIAAAAQDAVLAGELTDAEIVTLIKVGVNALAAVELYVPSEVLPA
jgi:hypothetical protein